MSKPRGIQLPCPMCGEPKANLKLSLVDVEATDAIECTECDGSFDLDHVRTIIAQWQPFLKWIDTAPFNC